MNITGIEVIKRNLGVAAIGVVAGEKIELTYDDTLRVNVSFDYRGLAMKTTLRPKGVERRSAIIAIAREKAPMPMERIGTVTSKARFHSSLIAKATPFLVWPL
ncbi:unnamed protein product [marine sediment metagenome]|uniref:Uncharacterized protein n=1 Tax=marine sediment metagenome TaxID=412755 RepID=X1VP47_9ZZZZ